MTRLTGSVNLIPSTDRVSQDSLDLKSITLLKDGYRRRLTQLNDQIRITRKAKQDTKPLTQMRKTVDKHYNLLVQLEIKYKPNDANQSSVYQSLLNLYQND